MLVTHTASSSCVSIRMWESAIGCIATLDVLVGMATYSAGIEGCRPEVTSCDEPYITIVGGIHPCVTQTFTGDDFIPNDVAINSDKVTLLLL